MASRRFPDRAAALAAVLLASAARASGPWSLSVGPSMLAPRLTDVNAAREARGIQPLESLYQGMSGAGAATRATGFPKIQFGVGGQLALGYELNEDLRGGLSLSNADAFASGSRTITVKSTIVSGTTITGSSTDFAVSQKLSLGSYQLTVFLQKMFRFEDNPNFMLYLGGWGSVGTLLLSQISGSVQMAGGPRQTYTAGLTGTGWGGGGLGGAEWQMSPRVALMLESGIDVFRIPNVQMSDLNVPALSLNGLSGNWSDGSGRTLAADFSGFFLRLGVRILFPAAAS